MGNEEQRDVKVVDRRRFTDQGELKDDRPADDEGVTPTSDPEKAPRQELHDEPSTPDSGESGERAEQGPSVPVNLDFRHLVDFLGQQAAIVLQGAEGIPPSRQQARLFIDLLAVLQEKTRGNLTSDEQKLLEEVLFQLRSAYVSHEGS